MGPAHPTGTNILLRLAKRDHPESALVRESLSRLERNGFGLSIAETEAGARKIESSFNLLPENELVYREWRHLVFAHQVRGAKVHDARLVAVMRAYCVHHLLTFNEADFRRYSDVIIVTPQSVLDSRQVD